MTDLSYDFKKQETKENGSYYYKKGMGKREIPSMSPYEYGSLLSRKKRYKR